MKFRRLRDRLSWVFGILLAVLVAAITSVVGAVTYRNYTEDLSHRLHEAPLALQAALQPKFLVFSQQGQEFVHDAELRRLVRDERVYHDEPGRELDYEAAYLTLVDQVRMLVEGPDSAELLVLFDLEESRTVLALRRPWVEPELGGKLPDLPPLHGLPTALRTLKPRLDFLFLDGELYAVTIVPLLKGIFSGEGDTASGVVLLGTRMSHLDPVGGFAMVLVGPDGAVWGRDETGCPYTREQLAQLSVRPDQPELNWLGRNFLVRSSPLGKTGTVYFLADTRYARNGVRLLCLATLCLGVLALLATRMVSVRLAGTVTRPLERLASMMRQVGEGNLTMRAPVESQDEVGQLAGAFNQMMQGLQEREAFRKLAPEGARREIERDSSIELGGNWVEATILFSDLRGFTSMSEKLAPTAVVELLNEYLQDMSVALKEHGGDINEYIGDAILAVFHDADGVSSSVHAVRAALAMQKRLDALRARTSNETLKVIKMGVGIHTGELVEGWIGAHDRIKYGVVGDTVNLAARIQDRSRDGKHTFILVSGATRDRLGEEFEVAFFGDETFKGKTGTTPVWEIVGAK